MDGENNGSKTLLKWDDLGDFTHIFGLTPKSSKNRTGWTCWLLFGVVDVEQQIEAMTANECDDLGFYNFSWTEAGRPGHE